jgi:rhodanese-related sulfurtransferase
MRRRRYLAGMDPLRSVLVVLAIVAPALGLTACGDDSSSSAGGPSSTSAPAPSRLVDPATFAKAVDEPNVVTINVHTPHGEDIPGTDAAIAFDTIATSPELPSDHSTELAIYCRSGNMSATAATALQAAGYTDVVELRGGYDAWVASGRPMQPSTVG